MPHLPSGYRLIALETIDSTNEEARRRAPLAHRTVIWAKQQTAGRGRRGRAWMSKPGNLFTSIVVTPDCPIIEAAQLSFVTALAMADMLKGLGLADKISLKWPNDVLVGGAKISGILLEASSSGAEAKAVIVGIGLNLTLHPDDTPYPATDVRSLTGKAVPPEDALEALVAAFEEHYSAWCKTGFEPVRQAWLDQAHGRGQPVSVTLDGEVLEGVFSDLDETGALVVDTREGPRTITAGDVFFAGEA
ncbi:MAG: biotin--[acetyl-CoA-carboxylase] ligase [Alphaproteobacteria bacterium]